MGFQLLGVRMGYHPWRTPALCKRTAAKSPDPGVVTEFQHSGVVMGVPPVDNHHGRSRVDRPSRAVGVSGTGVEGDSTQWTTIMGFRRWTTIMRFQLSSDRERPPSSDHEGPPQPEATVTGFPRGQLSWGPTPGDG